MEMKDCEVCGDVVTLVERARLCGHAVYLCDVCKVACPTALRYCIRCEDKGH
jgi:epoxyqueuosine reductase QueG